MSMTQPVCQLVAQLPCTASRGCGCARTTQTMTQGAQKAAACRLVCFGAEQQHVVGSLAAGASRDG